MIRKASKASAARRVPSEKKRAPVVLPPGAGRAYGMGPVHAVFKADGDETRGRYAISEWWLEPYTRGPGAHTHEEDDVFFVIEGTMSLLVGGAWIDAPKGSLVIAPGGTAHDFENRTAERVGALNLSVPGDFEPHMGGIAEWFRARSAAASRTANAPRGPSVSPGGRLARRKARA
ncbi:MAG TPA: cupin domain-containing protein [Polyangiaceae bacterium]|jgi:mannose-6-phosphate isomerase-like protein (cupin superfamily)|nr:cupin domain-containing protein [Polyangiaceae bacterium]